MLNSLPVFLSILVFILFGYLSVVRLIHKQQLSGNLLTTLFLSIRDYERNIRLIGYSTLLVTVPAISLLLYWGWGPALLWLVVFHLLFESIIHVQEALKSTLPLRFEVFATFPESANQLSKLPDLIWQAMMMLVCAVIVTELTRLIDQHSGIFWALLFIFPASAVLNTKHAAVPKTIAQITAAVIFCFGLVMADRLGVSVYGSWAPVGYLTDWLVLNNSSILALAVVVSSMLLINSTALKNTVASLAGYLIVACIVFMSIGIVTLQPELDAPSQSATQSGGTLPNFMALCLILFGSLLSVLLRSTLLSRLFDGSDPNKDFSQRQSMGLIQLLLACLLVLALAAASGIGAWNTHYANWNWSADLLRHFDLSQSASFSIAANHYDVGSLVHTLFISGAAIALVSLLLMCCSNLRMTIDHAELDQQQAEINFVEFILQSNIIHAVLVYLLSCFFLVHGVSLACWALIGVLAWFVFCHYLLGLAQSDQESVNLLFNGICLIVISVGWLQIIFTAIGWLSGSHTLFGLIALLIFASSIILWTKPLQQIVAQIRSKPDPALFEQ